MEPPLPRAIIDQFRVLFLSLAEKCERVAVSDAICDAARLSQVDHNLDREAIDNLVDSVFSGSIEKILELDRGTQVDISEWLSFLRGSFYRPRYGEHVVGLGASIRVLLEIHDFDHGVILDFACALAIIQEEGCCGAALGLLGCLTSLPAYDKLRATCVAAIAVMGATWVVRSYDYLKMHESDLMARAWKRPAFLEEWEFLKDVSSRLPLSTSLFEHLIGPPTSPK